VLRPIQWIDRLRALGRSPSLVPVLGILAAVVAGNLPALVHLVTVNPLVINANLTAPVHGVLPGSPYIDPNAGYTTQALGHLAALDWLHGHVPWWNPYEGAGAPLAGEMQSGAFFPPTLLLSVTGGLLAMQVLLELVAGWATYFLLVRLGVGRTMATAGGVAFGLCGTYAWFAHAPFRPVAFLPVCLVGVERALDAARNGRAGGWRLLAVALALSILAGFPETTLIDGLLVAWWAVLRIAPIGGGRLLAVSAKLAGAVAIGVALALPLLVAFLAYLPSSDIGPHSVGFANAALPKVGLVQDVLPYSLGPIFGLHSAQPANGIFIFVWDNVGGFLSATVVAGALVGLVGRRLRVLRLGLAAWIIFCLLRTYGDPTVLRLMAAIPGAKSIAFYRYANPSWELATVVLAALGLDDIARRRTRPGVLVGAVVVTGGLAAWAAATAWPLLSDAVVTGGRRSNGFRWYALGSLAGAVFFLVLLTVGGLLAAGRARRGDPVGRGRARRGSGSRRQGRLLVAAVVVIESVGLFGFTALSAPPPTVLQTGSVNWLMEHLGSQRFYTLGPIQPEYGSYFGIGQVNVDDLPLPKTWNDYIAARLDPEAPRGAFTGGISLDPSKSTPAEALSANLGAYEATGVRYVVEPANGTDLYGLPFPAVGAPPWPAGPRLVHRDTFAEIWELPDAAPLFSAVTGRPARLPATAVTSAGCAVLAQGADQVTVDCPHPAVVLRRVQYVPGWTATVDGRPVPVRPVVGGPFQSVTLPSGRSTVRFTYLPPGALASVGVAAGALLVLIASLVVPVIRARRRRTRAGDAGDDPAESPEEPGLYDSPRVASGAADRVEMVEARRTAGLTTGTVCGPGWTPRIAGLAPTHTISGCP